MGRLWVVIGCDQGVIRGVWGEGRGVRGRIGVKGERIGCEGRGRRGSEGRGEERD